MKKIILLSLTLIIATVSAFSQRHNYEGSVEYKKRRANGKIVLSPGDNSDIILNDTLIIRYSAGKLSVLGGNTERFGVTSSVMTLNGIYITGAEAVGQLYHTEDTTQVMSADSTWYLINGLTEGIEENLSLTDSSLVIDYPGYYEVSASGSLTHTVDSTIIDIGVFIDDELQEEIPIQTEVRAQHKFESVSGSGIIQVSEGDIITFKWKASKTGTVTTGVLNFNIKRL